MIIRVLIINRQLVFAVTIKQALEQTGAFEVHPFTDPDAAVEYLRSNPHDVALVDFDIQVQPGPEIVAQLRAVQPDIALVVSPSQSGRVLQELNLQDSVDAPFSARGIIPVIERAVEQMAKPSSAVTRSLVQPDEGGNLITDILPDEHREPPTERLAAEEPAPAETHILDNDFSDETPPDIADPVQTRILDDEDVAEPQDPAGTHILDDPDADDGPSADYDLPAQTRILDDDEGAGDESQDQAGTRILDDSDSDDVPPVGYDVSAQTHILDDEGVGESQDQAGTRILDEPDADDAPPAGYDVPAQTNILGDEPATIDDSFFEEYGDDYLSPPDEDIPTRVLEDEGEAPSPPTLPEFSSLDNVLSDEAPSALFEPPVRDDDTPAVPETGSDAVRQYLATTSDPEDSVFDDMLSAIPADEDAPDQPGNGSDFDNLVNSMRAEAQHTPLPDRHQQFVEFILTGGMDHLLTEIGKSGDEPPTLPEQEQIDEANDPQPASDVFQRLLEDEPPMPSLEDSGTIGDLMVGVSDSSFRNVLAMMRGQDVIDEESDEQSAQLRREIEAAYNAFFEQEVADEVDADDLPQAAPVPPEMPPEDEDDSAIPAQLILETALDESTPIESFSLNSLIGDIERQLTEHKPDVSPLPSWDIDSFRPKRRRQTREEAAELERYIKEPDFLPEELTEHEQETFAAKLSQAENLSEGELTDLSRDLFDEMVSAEARQQQMREAPALEEDVEQALPDETLDTPDAEIAEYQQETVPSAVVDEADIESPTVPDDEALLDAVEALPDESWDEAPGDWDAETVWSDSQPAVEAEAGEEAYPLLEDEQAIYTQETVLHQPDTEVDDADEVLAEYVAESLAADVPHIASEAEDDFTPAPSIDDIPATPTGVLPESLWDDMEDVSVLEDAEAADSDAYDEAELPAAFEDDWALTIDETPDEQTVLMDQPYEEPLPESGEFVDDFMPEVETFDIAEPNDPYVAQIALSLTQMSLELAAEATLVASEDEIVALAGHLDEADVEEIRDAIADDWDANADEARVRFITLPSSGKEYMLYSRKTVGDFTLSMIFAGTTPLRDIRRQGKRLQDALETVPDVIGEIEPAGYDDDLILDSDDAESEEIVETIDVGELQPYTYLWLLRDPGDSFDERRARMVTTSLGIQLREMGWQIETLQAQDEYVYVRADVPGEDPAYEVIDDLKRRVAEIIHAQEPDLPTDTELWADSYLVMMPGRELDPEEISQFISFERML